MGARCGDSHFEALRRRTHGCLAISRKSQRGAGEITEGDKMKPLAWAFISWGAMVGVWLIFRGKK